MWWNIGAAWSNNVQVTQREKLYSKTNNFVSIDINLAGFDVSNPYPMTYLENYTMMFFTPSSTATAVVDLPQTSLVGAGRFYIFQDVAGTANVNNVNIRSTAGDTINGGTAGAIHPITTSYGHVWLTSDGAGNWLINSSA